VHHSSIKEHIMFSFKRSLRRLGRDVESRKHLARHARMSLETLEDRSVPATFYQGFEDPSEVQISPTTTPGWNFSTFAVFQGTTRVPSGTGGITSLGGSWHAIDTAGSPTSATNWGGYSSLFPTGGYRTLTYFYLDVSAGHANDTRFDYSSAINDTLGSHRRDFIFHVGFYNSADLTGPGAGTNRFIFSVSHNSPGDPKNGIGGPAASFHISTTGWYGLEHRFYDAGGGQLACDFVLRDSSGTALNTWTLTPTSDIIGVTVGGNRYGWIVTNGFSSLAFDESAIFIGPPNVAYVSPTWGSLAPNTPILDADFGTAGNQPAVFGYDAFATIAAAQAAVGLGGTIIVNAGSYAATTLTGTQTLEITGPDAAQAVTIDSLTTSAGQTVILEGTSTLTVGDATSTSIAGVISGTGNLVKQGSGTLTLSGANTYTGTTTVNAGTLSVTGSTTSGTTVNSGATLGGTGSIAAPVAVNPGGTLNPGVAVGILSTGNYTQTGNLTIEIVNPISPATAGTDYDQLSVTGTVTLNPGATLTLAFVGSGQVPAETIYTLIANDGIDAVVGTFAGLPEGKIFTANGQRWQISYVGGDGNDVTLRALPPGNRLAVGAGTAAVGNPVVVYNPDLSVNSTANPYPQFAGGVRVASADVTGDGIADLITAPGVGGGPHIQVFDGVSGALINSFFAFEDTFRGGAFVAGGDLDGDGLAEVIVSADFGGGPRVVVFRGSAVASGQFVDGQTGDGVLVSFFGIPDPSFRGGARVAVGDVNGDGTPDIVVAAGEGGGPRVVVWDGKLLAGGMVPAAPLADFFAFDETLRTGAYVSVGDVTGDGLADLLIGAGPGGGPRVRLVDALSLLGLGGVGTLDGNLAGAELGSFFSGDASLRAGVPVAAADLDEDGLAELFSGAGVGQGGSVRVYLGSQLQSASSNPPINTELEPFGPGLFSGLFVG
jgi:autotransporter-associated beta strand protein